MKKFINKYFVGACALGLSMAATSCSDDYLDTKPTSSVSTSEAVGTTENAVISVRVSVEKTILFLSMKTIVARTICTMAWHLVGQLS